MINDLFSNKKKRAILQQDAEQAQFEATVPDGMWEKCAKCGKVVYEDDLYASLKVCPHCGHHFRLSARQRIACTVDENSFIEWNEHLCGSNPLSFPGYDEKLKSARTLTGLNDAVVTGSATIGGQKTALAVMDGNFMMGSMGFAVGEKITLAVERATKEQLPIVIFTVSGGARMQEGMVSLMQMAKVSSALQLFSKKGLLYVTVLTDPTTGGVTASFAMLGDIILSEPNALVGFAGRRVIEQTIRQTLPESFQTAEFVLQHGFIDAIVNRDKMTQTLAQLLRLHEKGMALMHEAWDVVMAARAPERPTAKWYIDKIFTDFIELHGDRHFADDKAIIAGIALFEDMPVTVICQEKGSTTDEKILRNFGSPHPEGYRKALRLMRQAEKFHRPIICLVDTQGAYCGIGAEERGQGQAIAQNLYEMSGLKVPILSIILGEGGSGGALALAVADRVAMMENAIYSILSPEGFASILWKDSKRAKEAAGVMKLTAQDLLEMGIIDDIIPETDSKFEDCSAALKQYLMENLLPLCEMDSNTRTEKRYERFRSM